MRRIRELTITSVVTQTIPSPAGGLVIATDGRRDSDGAVRVGVALARRDNLNAELYSVIEPLQVTDPEGALKLDLDQLSNISREARETELLAQRDRTHPGIHEWPFTIDIGPRVEAIVDRARRTHASLILLGLGEHGVAARLRQRETALRVIRDTVKPVLALPADAWGVPHSMLAAIDFTASSERAARVALDLLDEDGTLYLAHVSPRIPVPLGDARPWDEISTNTILPRLEAVARRLAPSPATQIEYVVLHGEPAHELLAFADQFHIDLVAAGAHGRTGLERLVLGSVSTKLVRTATRWVLIGPPMPEPSIETPNDWR